MGISGCTTCQLGEAEALKAYDNAFQARLSLKNQQEQSVVEEK